MDRRCKHTFRPDCEGLEGRQLLSLDIQLLQNLPSEKIWRIVEPVVTQRDTLYPMITFKPGDQVFVSAQGGVQTGGHGLTWKHTSIPSARTPTASIMG